jgi:glycine hydroxymethyltransferase
VASFLHEVLEECKAVQATHGKKLSDFTRGVETSAVLHDVRKRVEAWAGGFAMPGFDVSAL